MQDIKNIKNFARYKIVKNFGLFKLLVARRSQ